MLPSQTLSFCSTAGWSPRQAAGHLPPDLCGVNEAQAFSPVTCSMPGCAHSQGRSQVKVTGVIWHRRKKSEELHLMNSSKKKTARLQHDCKGSWLCPTKAGANQHHPVPPVGILEIRTNCLGKIQFSVISRNSQSSVSNILEGHWLQVTRLEGRARESRHVHCEALSPKNHLTAQISGSVGPHSECGFFPVHC